MALPVPTGTEIVYVQGVTAAGNFGATQFPVSLQSIANLAGGGSLGGTFIGAGGTAVTVTNTNILATTPIVISLNTVGGTVGAHPVIQTITSGSFTVTTTLADSSTYNYTVLL